MLTNTVYGLSTRGWTLFPGMYRAVETFSIPHSNVLALFGYELNKQIIVVENIRAFIGRIAHRALTDMVRMHQYSELADM